MLCLISSLGITVPNECTAAYCDLEATIAASLPYQVKLKHILDHSKKTTGDAPLAALY